jgi:hypothetical protein
MRPRIWITSFLTLLGIAIIGVNFSEQTIGHTNEQTIEKTSEEHSSFENGNLNQPARSENSKQTDSSQAASKTTDLSMAELSELSKQYIVQCKDPYSFLGNYSENAGLEIQEKIFESWSKSNQFEQKLAMALVHTNLNAITVNGQATKRKHHHTNLFQLVKDFPDSKLANYFLVAHCTEKTNCDPSVFDTALAQDPYNGALWRLIAIQDAATGDVESTLMAIENVIAAANYDSYWGETIHLFEQALASSVEMDELTRQISAIGYSATLIMPNFKTLLDFCREHSTKRADIANACLAMGTRQFLSGENLIEQHIGLETQKLVYEQQNNLVEVNKVETLRQEFRKATARLATAHNVALLDKDLNKYWWENILLYGETKALELTYAEAARLSSDPNYDPCPNGKIDSNNIYTD